MRLLLDEHYSQIVAERLREEHGHDVVAVTEMPTLTSRADAFLFAAMPTERRAIVTENVADFMPLAKQATATGREHYGLIAVSHRRFPRSRNTIAKLTAALDACLKAHPTDDALLNTVHWLDEAP